LKTVFSDTPHAAPTSATRTPSKPRSRNIAVAVSDSCWRISRFLRARSPSAGRPGAGDGASVTNRLEEIPGGTRLTWEHTGFHGIEGAIMSRLLGRVRRKMLEQGLPPVLADISR
jgi:hypothetical protein